MKLYILSTSDVHGYIAPSNFVDSEQTDFGLARAASLIKKFRLDHPNDLVLTIENGDFIQGSPLTNFIAQKHPEYASLYQKFADIIGYDVRILGNHEFNYGLFFFKKAIGPDAGVLDANVFERQKNLYPNPYKIFNYASTKIGVLGLTTEYIPHWETAAHLGNVHFENPVETAKKYIPIMRAQEADIIVVAYHAGFECDLNSGEATEKFTGENRAYELLQQVPGIDALVTGHQHRKLAQLVDAGHCSVPVTQPGYQAEAVGEIELDFDPANKQITRSEACLLPTKNFVADTDIMQKLNQVQKQLDSFLDEKIGEIQPDMLIKDPFAARLHGHPYLSMINKVQGQAVHADISATALFSDGQFGLGNVVTRRAIATNYLFPNTAVAEEVSGRDLLSALERAAEYFIVDSDGKINISDRFGITNIQHYNYDYFSGIDYTFDLTQPFGHRVKNVSYQGKKIELNKKYRLAISNYRSSGVGGYTSYSVDKIVESSTVDMVDLISNYIADHSPIKSQQPTNLTIISK
ncbi:bifunctional metallophosphatase/5'-nucleotidase [Oenococcus kitaharae]|uniref:bifunctional metallophosphatase/5'-nucleotidase n=1 Tax=Oenococcus kitaharae TaxID=336988 RepID=UPI000482E10B|nr:bifunctional UDP-sugar hydrolase/5'-nucleotidase [Oenococcus kitaharae]